MTSSDKFYAMSRYVHCCRCSYCPGDDVDKFWLSGSQGACSSEPNKMANPPDGVEQFDGKHLNFWTKPEGRMIMEVIVTERRIRTRLP